MRFAAHGTRSATAAANWTDHHPSRAAVQRGRGESWNVLSRRESLERSDARRALAAIHSLQGRRCVRSGEARRNRTQSATVRLPRERHGHGRRAARRRRRRGHRHAGWMDNHSERRLLERRRSLDLRYRSQAEGSIRQRKRTESAHRKRGRTPRQDHRVHPPCGTRSLLESRHSVLEELRWQRREVLSRASSLFLLDAVGDELSLRPRSTERALLSRRQRGGAFQAATPPSRIFANARPLRRPKRIDRYHRRDRPSRRLVLASA